MRSCWFYRVFFLLLLLKRKIAFVVVVMSAVIFMILSNFLSRFKDQKKRSKKLSQSFTTSALIAVCCSNLWSENYALPTTQKKIYINIRKGHVHRRKYNNWVTSFTSLAHTYMCTRLIRLFETSLRLMETNGFTYTQHCA